MLYIKNIWRSLKIRWWAWRNEREYKRLKRLVEGQITTLQQKNPDLFKPISYQDAHFEHYEQQTRSLPPPFMPPPDVDDGLN